MDVITSFNLQVARSSGFYCSRRTRGVWKSDVLGRLRHHRPRFSFSFMPYPFRCLSKRLRIYSVRKKQSDSEPILKPSIVIEATVDENEEEDVFLDDLEDVEELDGDGDDFPEDEYLEVEEPVVGDGCGGGGVSLAGTSWDKTVLGITEKVAQSFEGDLGIYAFKTMLNGTIHVRIEKLTNKSGSPSLMEVEAFSSVYKKRLEEAEVAGSIPGNLSFEVSSPGVERVVRVPYDLERFKDRPLYVKYIISKVSESDSESVCNGVFMLLSFNLETGSCIWGLADVRLNREKAGKGRPLSKKQRDWRLNTTFDSLVLVRLCSEF